jgi:hypothetical protein
MLIRVGVGVDTQRRCLHFTTTINCERCYSTRTYRIMGAGSYGHVELSR